MEEYWSEIVSLVVGLIGGATIGSLISIRVVRTNQLKDSRTVSQANVRAGRDNIGGDRITK